MIVSEPHIWWPEACKVAISGVHSMEDSIHLAQRFCSLVDPSLSFPDLPDGIDDVSSWIEQEMSGMKSQISSLTDDATYRAIEEEVDLFFKSSFELCDMWLKAALSCEIECRGIVKFVVESISMLDFEKERLMSRCPLTPARITMYEKLHSLSFSQKHTEGLSVEDVDGVTSLIESASSDDSCLKDIEDVGEKVRRQMRLQSHVNDIVLNEHETLSSSLRKGAKRKTDTIKAYHLKAASIAHDQMISFLNQSRSDCAAKVMRSRISGEYQQESSSHVSNLCISLKKLCTIKLLHFIKKNVRFLAESIHPDFKCKLDLHTKKETEFNLNHSQSEIEKYVNKPLESHEPKHESSSTYTNPYTPLSEKEKAYREYILKHYSNDFK